jgi:hypothetical protein
MHFPFYVHAQVTLGLGVGFALLMSWSSVKLANCIGHVSHVLFSTHVSTRLQKKPTHIHDNRIHKFCHVHPFNNLESSIDSLVSKRALAMDDKFHLRLQLPVPCGKEEALLSRCRPTLYMFELTEAQCV